MTTTITANEATAARSAVGTPGRRRIVRSGAAGPVGPVAVPSRSAIFFGSGRTKTTIESPISIRTPAVTHGATSSDGSSPLPAKSGLNTKGPKSAPTTEPLRTYEMPRARRSGGYMSPPAARESVTVPVALPIRKKPMTTPTPEEAPAESAVTRPPAAPRTNPVAMTGMRPRRSIARPAGSAAHAALARKIAGPRPRSPSNPVASTKVVDASAATSWSAPEVTAMVAASRIVLRRTVRWRSAVIGR